MDNRIKHNVLILLGPTGIGKTKTSIKLAEKLTDIEIISADSMQIYKYMDVGTAKPEKAILNKVKHHMIDIINPDQRFDASKYSKLSIASINNIINRNKIPIIVGGSGLYISSIINPLFKGPSKNNKYREKLEEEVKTHGKNYLHEKLSKIDPISSSKIKPNDLRRIIRALEVYKLSGKTISSLQEKDLDKRTIFKYHIIGLKIDREYLYNRINLRVDNMFRDGFVEEVKMLRKMGYDEKLYSMQSLGYKQINKYLNGECSKKETIDSIKTKTRNYVKRQMTWFNNKIKNIEWINLDEYDENEVISKIIAIIMENYNR